MKRKTIQLVVPALIFIFYLVLSIMVINQSVDNKVTIEEPKAKMLVGKLCVELDETQSQFRAKQDLWRKAFGFTYIECK